LKLKNQQRFNGNFCVIVLDLFRLTPEGLAKARQTFTESFEACVLDYVSHLCAGEVAARARRCSVL
jgi:hypothetical protein